LKKYFGATFKMGHFMCVRACVRARVRVIT